MDNRNRLLLFILLSFSIHIFIVIYYNPSSLLFSNIQNIKLKKNITKVKLIKIIEKPKIKPKPISKPQSIPKIKIEHRKVKPVLKKKIEKKKNISKQKKVKLSKKKKKKTIIHKKIEKKIDLRAIQKKIKLIKEREKKRAELKKKLEAERKRREKLKNEAAIFYSNKIVSLIQSLWVLPKGIDDSELTNLEIKVKLRVNKDGKIIGTPVILNESKNKYFNESALRALKKLNNYKIPLPDIIDEQYLDIVITLVPPNF